MNGAGNDFIIIDNRTAGRSEKELSALAAHLCERRMSIGADGLIAVDTARLGGDFRMRFFNSDGSVGEMCGNGARCICRYGCENGLAGSVQRVETDAGMIEGMRLSQREYRVLMGSPSRVDFDIDVVVYDAHAGCRRVYKCDYVELGNPGVPHAVVEYKGLRELVTHAVSSGKNFDFSGCRGCFEGSDYFGGADCSNGSGGSDCSDGFGGSADPGFEPGGSTSGFVFRGADEESVSRLRETARAIRHAACFPKGANVNFFEFMEDGRIFEVTFERGVEDFTYACGSGSASCAIVLALRGRLPKCKEPSGESKSHTGTHADSLHEKDCMIHGECENSNDCKGCKSCSECENCKDCTDRLSETAAYSGLYTVRLLMRGGELRADVELAAETQDANVAYKNAEGIENASAESAENTESTAVAEMQNASAERTAVAEIQNAKAENTMAAGEQNANTANAEMLSGQRHAPAGRAALVMRVYLSGPTNMVAAGRITDDDLPKLNITTN